MHPVTVKQEMENEEEIQGLAAKMAEAIRAEMSVSQEPQIPQCQKGFLNGFSKNIRTEPVASAFTSTQGNIDEESFKGRFGWTTLGAVHIPYIFRSGDKYSAVRMVKLKLLKKFLNFFHHDIIYNCTCIRSYYITDVERRLLNEINGVHSGFQFGKKLFSTRDLIVRLSDVEEFNNFLDVCYHKLLNRSQNVSDRCGFIRIDQQFVLPYTVQNQQRYVPIFYFECETDYLNRKAEKLEGWDLSYLKLCCKVQGIKSELYAQNSCSVIRFSDTKNCFPPGTLFEDYWPKQELYSQLLSNGNNAQSDMIQWAKTPVAPPVPATQAQAQENNQQIQNVQAMHSPNYGHQANLFSSGVGRQIRPTIMAQAPPPSVWSTEPPASYTNAQTIANAMVVGRESFLVQDAQQQKYPGQEKNFTATQGYPQAMVNEQPAHHHSDFTMSMNSFEIKLTPLSDPPARENCIPYQLHKAVVQERVIFCINMKPYVCTELLVTLPELMSNLFHNTSVQSCYQAMSVLGIELYKANMSQMRVLLQNGMCQSLDEVVPLVPVGSVVNYMPQLTYTMANIFKTTNVAKQ